MFASFSKTGAATKLNPTLVDSEGITSVQISPDGSRVVYLADQETDDVFELFSVPIAGGPITKLNSTLVASGDVSERSLQISPDGSRVVYLADQDTDEVLELFSVSIAGGPVTKLNSALVAGGNIDRFRVKISPDSSRVVYRADQETDNVDELFSVPITGGSVTKLTPTANEEQDLYATDIQISHDSSRVVYLSDQDTNRLYELFSVPIAGGPITKLNPALIAGGRISSGDVQISPDGRRVVYLANQEASDKRELYSVPIAGGPVTKLNSTLGARQDVFRHFQISPDSNRVVYLADPDTNNVVELFSVAITGGQVTKLNSPLVAGGDVDALNVQISPDSSRVVYFADQQTNERFELFSVSITGGAVTKLNPTLITGGYISSIQISPDGSRVVYGASQETPGVSELFSVPITGGSVTKLNPTPATGGYVSSRDAQISPDGSRVVYRADQDANGVADLFSVPITGGPVTKLNPTPITGGNVSTGVQISSDSSRVVYLVDQEMNDIAELFSMPLSTCPAIDFSPSRSLCQENFDGVRDWDTQARPALEQTVIFRNTNRDVRGAILEMRGLAHTRVGDLSFELVAPNGTTSLFALGSRVGGGSFGDSSDVGGEYRFIDGAASFLDAAQLGDDSFIVPPGSYAPSETDSNDQEKSNSFATTFEDVPAKGTWTLRLLDRASGNTGVLSNWRLILLTKESPSSVFIIKARNGKVFTFQL